MSPGSGEPYRTAARAPVAFEGTYVLRPRAFVRWLCASLLIASTVAGVVVLAGTHTDADRVSRLPGVGAILVIAMLLTLVTSLVNRVVSVHGITGPVRFRRTHIAWKDVFSVSLGAYDVFSVRSSTGQVISVPRRWTNIDAFARAVTAHLEPDKLWDAKTRRTIAVLAGRVPVRRGHATTVARTRLEGEGEEESASAAVARWRDNPFFVLGVAPDCSRVEAERAGEKMLALLAVGASAAKTYATPVGPAERTPDKVRAALAEVREPTKRIVHEVWARVPVADGGSAAPEVDPPTRPWREAMRAVGWRNA